MLNSAVRGTHVGVDGRMRVCQAPCNLQLLPGHHVVVFEADGFSTQVENAVGIDGAQLQMTLNPASPSEASDQWTARYSGVQEGGRGFASTFSPSVGRSRLGIAAGSCGHACCTPCLCGDRGRASD